MTVSAVWPDRMVVRIVKYETVAACKAMEIGDRVAT
jgi:cell division septal protein FtsQ